MHSVAHYLWPTSIATSFEKAKMPIEFMLPLIGLTMNILHRHTHTRARAYIYIYIYIYNIKLSNVAACFCTF